MPARALVGAGQLNRTPIKISKPTTGPSSLRASLELGTWEPSPDLEEIDAGAAAGAFMAMPEPERDDAGCVPIMTFAVEEPAIGDVALNAAGGARDRRGGAGRAGAERWGQGRRAGPGTATSFWTASWLPPGCTPGSWRRCQRGPALASENEAYVLMRAWVRQAPHPARRRELFRLLAPLLRYHHMFDCSSVCLHKAIHAQATIGFTLPTYMFVLRKNQRLGTGYLRHCAHQCIIASSCARQRRPAPRS